MLYVINDLMQKREKEQRRKLQQFLNDLALLGSLQVSERTSGVHVDKPYFVFKPPSSLRVLNTSSHG